MELHNGKYIVGSVQKYSQKKGWFFGHFMMEDLLRSDLVDIAWQDYDVLESGEGKPHYHEQTIEVNIVIRGSADCVIEGTHVHVKAGEFYILWPKTIMNSFKAAPHTLIIVVRAPSIETGGKVLIK